MSGMGGSVGDGLPAPSGGSGCASAVAPCSASCCVEGVLVVSLPTRRRSPSPGPEEGMAVGPVSGPSPDPAALLAPLGAEWPSVETTGTTED